MDSGQSICFPRINMIQFILTLQMDSMRIMKRMRKVTGFSIQGNSVTWKKTKIKITLIKRSKKYLEVVLYLRGISLPHKRIGESKKFR